MIEKDKNQMLSAHAALFSVGLIYGLNYSIAKLIMNGGYIQPSGFIFCRVAFGSLFFVLVFFFRQGKFKINLSDVPRFIACGLFGCFLGAWKSPHPSTPL
jgi:drug/metabolite transporter (DMT)-like permease